MNAAKAQIARTVLEMIADEKRSSLRYRAGDQPNVRTLADIALEKMSEAPATTPEIADLVTLAAYQLGTAVFHKQLSPGGNGGVALREAQASALHAAAAIEVVEPELAAALVRMVNESKLDGRTSYEREMATITVATRAIEAGTGEGR